MRGGKKENEIARRPVKKKSSVEKRNKSKDTIRTKAPKVMTGKKIKTRG